MHQLMAATLDAVVHEIRVIREAARAGSEAATARPRWPMIVFQLAERVDRSKGDRREEDEGLLAFSPGAHGRDA
jgi:phosphoketolase